MEKTVCKMFKWNSSPPRTMHPKNLSIHSISSESFSYDSLLSASNNDFPDCSFVLSSSQDYSEDIDFIKQKNLDIKKALKSKVTDLKHFSKQIIGIHGEDIHTDTQSLINKSDKVSEVKNSETHAEELDGKTSNLKGLVESLEFLKTEVRATADRALLEKEKLQKHFDEYEKLKKKIEENTTEIEGDGTLKQDSTNFCKCFIV